MAFDEVFAQRVRDLLAARGGVSERQMFGGIGFMAGGNMCVGVIGDDLIVRLPAEDGERALAEQHVREFDYTGRPMRGWVCVSPAGTASDEQLRGWVDDGFAFASSLPEKQPKRS